MNNAGITCTAGTTPQAFKKKSLVKKIRPMSYRHFSFVIGHCQKTAGLKERFIKQDYSMRFYHNQSCIYPACNQGMVIAQFPSCLT